jgi:hypothetical protein
MNMGYGGNYRGSKAVPGFEIKKSWSDVSAHGVDLL